MKAEPAFIVIALDGGAASGKSSTSRELARRKGWLHVDTGAHYRAVTQACLAAGKLPGDVESLRGFVSCLELATVLDGQSALVAVNGVVPGNEALRAPEVNKMVSHYAAIPEVREAVKQYQRAQVEIARSHGFRGIIMDGRDIGSVILPDADLKIYLYADIETREARRSGDGESDSIGDRDRIDSGRALAPLTIPADAICIDNSRLSLEQVVQKILEHLNDNR